LLPHEGLRKFADFANIQDEFDSIIATITEKAKNEHVFLRLDAKAKYDPLASKLELKAIKLITEEPV
jgi:hypothetical protein